MTQPTFQKSPIKEPFFDPAGNVSRVWIQFFNSLQNEKGVILQDVTTGIYYIVQVDSGVVVATPF